MLDGFVFVFFSKGTEGRFSLQLKYNEWIQMCRMEI